MTERMKLIVGLGVIWFSVAGGLTAAESPKTFQVGAFSFDRPADWLWVQTSSRMRAAQMSIPDKASGTEAEVVFFYFGPGNGGGTQANVDRWLGQFQEEKSALKSKVEEIEVGGRKTTYVSAEGTFMSGPPLGQKKPMPGYMLMGAIMEHPQGSVFVKMTGPVKLTQSAIGPFKKMVESARLR